MTPSAYDALSSIRTIIKRKALKDISIWVDANCINQDNVTERNEQVGQMGRIYRSTKVLIYLGPETAPAGNELPTVTSAASVERNTTPTPPDALLHSRSEAAV
ncbi:hypothetical protein CLAFUW4_14801 [Fulvia fulva]|uniref:Heterokaryon incompatibility domain-containing protein n=1 Tax=Passalora fulva TaxID=5499 RepID=A0A9Q8PMN0_PASFU|nr:uncharacterized protein CLAFUR5_14626 [Fulvia fulva]KAK4608833.1 hypothetical protein CLAFUR4_14799 [Fulvia fulva]KAK4609544.1 hypothetical protein CLAFUR0_14793 [Fulvia fulva]UJO25232.1 hypothetical protein CLAFUR5_14626 [Fulvia fulva]WPV22558.1 hypothetical protein CLAFUW4_14801 [Fulvia fulva]WPV37456.1 hypothetical protein CLAFUW7_14802 [Fulvia fulva]